MLFYVNLWNAETKAWLGGVLLDRDNPARAGHDAGAIAAGYLRVDMDVELSVRATDPGFCVPASVLERLLTVEDLDRVELAKEPAASEGDRLFELPAIQIIPPSDSVH